MGGQSSGGRWEPESLQEEPAVSRGRRGQTPAARTVSVTISECRVKRQQGGTRSGEAGRGESQPSAGKAAGRFRSVVLTSEGSASCRGQAGRFTACPASSKDQSASTSEHASAPPPLSPLP